MIYDAGAGRQDRHNLGMHPPYMIRCCLGMKWRQEDAYRTAADARHESHMCSFEQEIDRLELTQLQGERRRENEKVEGRTGALGGRQQRQQP